MLGLEVTLRRLHRSSPRRRVVYFLHIGKAAGSQLKHAISQINAAEPRLKLAALTHDVFLQHLPQPADYFFSIRDPISRFQSGFYSRKRRGRPLYDIAWTTFEVEAFNRFEHANDLAEALFAPGELGMHALAAIKSIRHTAQDQIDWFVLAGDIFVTRPPVWVIRQEHFEADLATLVRRLGLTIQPNIVRDSKGAHRNDYSNVPALSEQARANLRRWYAQDFALYEAVENWMAQKEPFSAQ
jgi:hypothetical protein